MANCNQMGCLDRIRLRRGHVVLRRQFRTMLSQNRRQAFYWLNEERLLFPTLFLLLPPVLEENLQGYLSPRNKAALRVCARRLKWGGPPEYSLPVNREDEGDHNALKWMFETGRGWDGPLPEFDAFDAVLDTAAALLVVTFQDRSVLPGMADLIFRRNRRGLYIHDLAWSFFQSFDPDSALFLAKYLTSSENADVELACQLLHLGLPENGDRPETRRDFFLKYRTWLKENRPYLYFTGEQFQLTSDPEPLRADPEAKYLQKEISPRHRTPVDPMTGEELELLNRFRTCSEKEQEELCEYSAQLRKKDRNAWEVWRRDEPARQVLAARSNREVV